MGCLVVFLVPFMGVGVVMGVSLFLTIWTWAGMQTWEEAPARILHSELKSHSGSDSTTYRAAAKYEYTYGGRNYTGSRVSLHGGADNIGKFQRRTARELSKYKKSGKPFRCYVNPRNPSQSVLYRHLRLEMLAFKGMFALVFGGVGFGFFIAALRGYKKQRLVQDLKKEHPSQPWLYNEEWRDGRIRSSTKGIMIFSLLFSLFWNSVSIPLAILLVPGILEEKNLVGLLILVFPFAGICLVAWAVRNFLQWRKYGDSIFEMDSIPGVIGGALGGHILTTVNIKPEGGFHLTLSCIHRTVSRSGKSRSTKESVLWQDTRVMMREELEYDLTRSSIPVLFAIPYDSRETNEENSSDAVFWRLDVNASVPGVDYKSSFKVPVFKTEESSPDFVPDERSVSGYMSRADPALLMRSAGIRLEQLSTGGVAYVFPMGRQLGTALGLAVFLLIWTGALMLMIHLKAPLIFPIIFGFFEILLIYATLDLLFGTGRIEASYQGLTLKGGIFGLGHTRQIPREQISDIKPVKGMQSGNRLYFRIEVHTHEGKSFKAGRHLGSLREAEFLIGEINRLLGR